MVAYQGCVHTERDNVVYWKTNRKIKICAGIVIILVCVTNITANIHLNN